MCIDIGTMYLNTKLLAPEYMRIHSTAAFKIRHIVIMQSFHSIIHQSFHSVSHQPYISTSKYVQGVCNHCYFMLLCGHVYIQVFSSNQMLCCSFLVENLVVCVCVCVHQQQNEFYFSSTRTGKLQEANTMYQYTKYMLVHPNSLVLSHVSLSNLLFIKISNQNLFFPLSQQ